ncbi:MAG: pirin family protein [Actinobacteria bacterium]|nr:pirin family protein [Actinomycetota bacterium]
MSTFEIRRGADRVHTRTDWLDSAHSFSFGAYYDPDNLGFGPLQAVNSDVLQPGPGYPVHAHRDVEILTWVLAGSLTHLAEGGEPTVVPAGDLHHVSAGSGIRHTEFSSFADRPVRLVQMWLRPDVSGVPPSSARLAVGDRLDAGGLVLLASGQAETGDVLRIRQRDAALRAARLPVGESVTLPAAPLVHVYLTGGAVTVDGPAGQGAALSAGDALRLTGGPTGPALTAVEPAELLVWQLPA